MRTHARSLSAVAAALLLAAATVTLPGCDQKGAGPPPPPRPLSTACKPDGINPRAGVPVTVFVNYDPKREKKAWTDNKKIFMCEEDWVVWQSCEGQLEEPRFPAASPFDKPFKPGDKSLKSDKLKKGTAKQKYEYTIALVVGTNPPENVDPIIEVME